MISKIACAAWGRSRGWRIRSTGRPGRPPPGKRPPRRRLPRGGRGVERQVEFSAFGRQATIARRPTGAVLPAVIEKLLPPALAHRERRLPRTEGGLRAGGAAVGAGRLGGALPDDAASTGVQHGAGLPE